MTIASFEKTKGKQKNNKNMTNYLRSHVPGATYFFTVNCAERKGKRILTEGWTMYETANKVLASARELKITSEEFRQVSPGQWGSVLKSIFEEFSITSNTGVTWLWEKLKKPGVKFQTEHALQDMISLFEPETNVWVLLEDWDRTKKNGNYWLFEGGYGATIDVLNNMHGIEYYIVDKKLNWMIMENHHDVLIAVGEPAELRLVELINTLQSACADAKCQRDQV